MKRHLVLGYLLLLVALLSRPAEAVLQIEIRQGVGEPLPVALVPFGWQGDEEPEAAAKVAEVVAADLKRAGLFRLIDPADFLNRPHTPGEVRFKNWRLIGADAVVIGRIQPLGGERIEVGFWLYDVFTQRQIAGIRYRAGPQGLHWVAHRIADKIHKELIGWPGAFASRFAYVVRESDKFRLVVADSDGANPQTVFMSQSPVLSPAWSPGREKLAYVSFEHGHSAVYVQGLQSGERRVVAGYEGINSAPTFSPDGTRLALTLSKDGNPEIYILRLADDHLRRVTHSPTIDTGPTWSPGGDALIFTSDRGGSPQLYRLDLDGGQPKRLTFQGGYNAAPDWSPNGRWVTFVHGEGQRFAIAVLDLEKENPRVQRLTEFGAHESPSFAPNSRQVVYATQASTGARGELAIVSVDGAIQQRVHRSRPGGDLREPVWSPTIELDKGGKAK